MEREDWLAFAQVWNETLETKGQKQISPGALKMCFHDLNRYSFDTINRALERYRKTGKYHLQPSAIIEMIEGDSKTAANKAWQQALRVAKSVGDSSDLILKDGISMICIEEMGGLQSLCNCETGFDLKDFGRAFVTLYEHYRTNGFDKTPTVLPGTNNSERKRFGLHALPPRMIGFEKDNKPALPDMSRPRYAEIQGANQISPKEANENLKALFSAVNPRSGE